MSEMFKPKQFDSFDKVPEDQKKNFKKEEDGSFFYNEAAEELSDAEATVEIANIFKKQGVTALDILQERATNMQNKKAFELSEELVEAKKEVLKYVEKDYFYELTEEQIKKYIQNLPKELHQDEDVMSAIAGGNDFAFRNMPEESRRNLRIVSSAAKRRAFANILEDLPKELQEDKDFNLEIIKANNWLFKYLPEKLRDNDEIALAALKGDGELLEYASERIKKKKDFVRTAVEKDPSAFRYASGKLKIDENFILDLIEKSPSLLRVTLYHCEKEFMLKAIEKNPLALKYADKKLGLQSDREVVLSAIKRNPSAVFGASKELRSDSKIILEVIKGYMSNKLKGPRKESLVMVLDDMEVSEEKQNEIIGLLEK